MQLPIDFCFTTHVDSTHQYCPTLCSLKAASSYTAQLIRYVVMYQNYSRDPGLECYSRALKMAGTMRLKRQIDKTPSAPYASA